MSMSLIADVGLKEETSYGTEATPPDVFIDVVDESLMSENAIIPVETCSGNRSLSNVLPGPYKANGTINMYMNPVGWMGWALKGLFGQVSTTDLGGGAYSHEFTAINSSALPSYTIYTDRVAAMQNWLGCVFSQMSWTDNVDEAIKVGWDVVSKNPVNTTHQTATYSDVRELIWSDLVVTLNSATNTDVENLSFSINNGVDPVSTHNGTRFIKRIVPTNFAVEGSMDLEFNDQVQLQRFWGAASATSPQNSILTNTLSLAYTSPDEIASSGEYYGITFEFPAAIWSTAEPHIPGPNARIMAPLGFLCKVGSGADDHSVKVTLVNSDSDYVL